MTKQSAPKPVTPYVFNPTKATFDTLAYTATRRKIGKV